MSEPSFRYIGGDPSVDYVNTVDWTPGGLTRELMTSYPALLDWAVGARLLDGASRQELGLCAAREPGAAAEVAERARQFRGRLRAVLQEAANGLVAGETLAGISAMAEAAASRRRLVPGSSGESSPVRWDVDQPLPLDHPLLLVASAAAALLTSADARRLRTCGGDDCGWMYVDRSRNGKRRWCEMGTCGTRAKSTRRAERASLRRQAGAEGRQHGTTVDH